MAAEVRDRGASDDPEGPTAPGAAYWPEVGRLLLASYRSLSSALGASQVEQPAANRDSLGHP